MDLKNKSEILRTLSAAPQSELAKIIQQTLGSLDSYRMLLLLLITSMNIITSINDTIPSIYGYTPKNYACSNEVCVALPTFKWYFPSFQYIENSTCTPGCSRYEFFNDSDTSIVTEFSLVCDRRYLFALSTTIYFIGITIGSLLCGVLSDFWGRRSTLLVCLFVQGVFGVSVYFSQNLVTFIVLRFIQGFFIQVCVHVLSPRMYAYGIAA